MTDTNEKWETAKKRLKTQTADLPYKAFFEPLQFIADSDKESTIYISWPGPVQWAHFINFLYLDIIEQTVSSVWGKKFYVIMQHEGAYLQNAGSLAGCDIEAFRPDNEFSFDRFVVEKSNVDAFSAVKFAGVFPSGSNDPLMIYGESGLGKTHLLQAAAQYISEHYPDMEVLYISAEALTDGIMEVVKRGTIQLLKWRIQKCDALIVDDIQYMLGCDTVQEVFLDIVGDLCESQKQVIIAGNYYAIELMGFDIRLKKRFPECVTAEIGPPEYEIIKPFLLDLASKRGLDMTQDMYEVIDYIAHKPCVSLYDARGELYKILQYAPFFDEPITLSLARRILEPIWDNWDEEVEIGDTPGGDLAEEADKNAFSHNPWV